VLIRPAKSLEGELSLPGDKSISHRAAIISALAEGESRIENYSTGEDCQSTLRCLRQLGVQISQEGATVTIQGVGKTGLKRPTAPLDCGNSGTTMRLMSGVLAGQNFESILTGDHSLCRRPMKRVIEPLKKMGASIESNDGLPPLTIEPTSSFHGIDYKIPVSSAQVKSCVLLAGLLAAGETTVRETVATRDHSERMLRGFGVDVQSGDFSGERWVTVSRDSALFGRDIFVPGDVSAAAFFLVAAACLNGSQLMIKRLGGNPTRTAIIDVMSSCGLELEKTNEGQSLGEPFADLVVRKRANSDTKLLISGGQTAELIDELPVLAVLGSQLKHGIEVRDARELRVKETDRIAAVVENLRRMNASVEEFDDGFRVERSQLHAAEIDSFGDHRIAMAFAVAGLLADGETNINNAACADISFPGFFETLESVVKR
jgi:3-phosphoshikimate 1-carboxyvinyltransferase